MKEYLTIKSELESCESKFIDEGTSKSINLEVIDSISIEKIKKETAHLLVKRVFKFAPLINAYVKVVYSAILEAKEAIEKDQLKKDLRAELPLLSNVYSRISLLMAQVTNESMFGAVIMPPMYEGERVEIIDNCK